MRIAGPWFCHQDRILYTAQAPKTSVAERHHILDKRLLLASNYQLALLLVSVIAFAFVADITQDFLPI